MKVKQQLEAEIESRCWSKMLPLTCAKSSRKMLHFVFQTLDNAELHKSGIDLDEAALQRASQRLTNNLTEVMTRFWTHFDGNKLKDGLFGALREFCGPVSCVHNKQSFAFLF